MLNLFLLYTNSYGKLLFIDRGKVRYQNDYCTRVTVNIIVLHIVAVSLHGNVVKKKKICYKSAWSRKSLIEHYSAVFIQIY